MFKKITITIITFISIVLMSTSVPSLALAQGGSGGAGTGAGGSGGGSGGTGFNQGLNQAQQNIAQPGSGLASGTVEEAITSIITFGMSLAALIALGAIVAGGVFYIISLGNDQKIETAKKVILYAVIGLIVIGASFVIIWAVGQIFV